MSYIYTPIRSRPSFQSTLKSLRDHCDIIESFYFNRTDFSYIIIYLIGSHVVLLHDSHTGNVKSERPATPGQNFHINPFRRSIVTTRVEEGSRSKVPTDSSVFGKDITVFLEVSLSM